MNRCHYAILLAICLSAPTALLGQESQNPNTVERPKAEALERYPLDAVVDDSGVVFIVDRKLPGVWKFEDGQLTEYIVGSKRFREPLNAARAIAIDSVGKLLIGDTATREVYRVDDPENLVPTLDAAIGIPMDLAVDSQGTLYIADLERRVLFQQKPGKPPQPLADVNPRGVFVDSDDNVWVVSQNKAQLLKLPKGFAKGDQPEEIVAERTFEFPHQVVVDSAGTAWVTDSYKKALWKVPAGGQPTVVIEGEPLDNPVGLVLVDDRPAIIDPRALKAFQLNEAGELEVWIDFRPSQSEPSK